jgi:prepilin-type N-terminal cleavage/methylation domain-containing protein
MPANRTSSAPPAKGFTLIELLVVIGIIALLAGLVLPAVLRSYRSADRARTQADLALIGTALNAYHADFGDYPRFDDSNVAGSLNMHTDRGAILLCRALIGPGPMGHDAVLKPSEDGTDGADGYGFRARRTMGAGPDGTLGNADDVVAGKVYGPYVQPDKFKLGGSDKTDFSDATILDRDGHPILYYPATPHANIQMTNGFVAQVTPPGNGASPSARPLYNASDDSGVGIMGSLPTPVYLFPQEMQYILGDRDQNGQIESTTTPPEAATYTGPYILWTAGADGTYGRDKTGKCDDVTNFDIPADLRK